MPGFSPSSDALIQFLGTFQVQYFWSLWCMSHFFLTNILERVNRKRARVRAREIKALPLGRKTLVVGKSPLPTMADNLGPIIGRPLWTHQDKLPNRAILTISRSEQAPRSVFHPRDENTQIDCGFLGPFWCKKKLYPKR